VGGRAGARRRRGRGARRRALGDGPQVHEVAVAAARARVLLVLPAGGLPEVGHGAELDQDGPPGVEAAGQALQRARGRVLVVELRARARPRSARVHPGPDPLHVRTLSARHALRRARGRETLIVKLRARPPGQTLAQTLCRFAHWVPGRPGGSRRATSRCGSARRRARGPPLSARLANDPCLATRFTAPRSASSTEPALPDAMRAWAARAPLLRPDMQLRHRPSPRLHTLRAQAFKHMTGRRQQAEHEEYISVRMNVCGPRALAYTDPTMWSARLSHTFRFCTSPNLASSWRWHTSLSGSSA